MAIIQEAFDIPDDIAVGLASGLYKRIGGVVRYAIGANKGQIVKHLDPIILPGEKLTIAEKAFEIAKNNKKLVIGAAVVIGVATIAGTTVAIAHHKKKIAFQEAFNSYVEEIRKGTLNVETITNLEAALSNMHTVELKPSELSMLVDHIRNYTKYLAENNEIDFKIKESDTPIIDLKRYLAMQKKILRTARTA